MDFKRVENAFKEAVIQGVFPGAVLLVGRGDEIVYEHGIRLAFARSHEQSHAYEHDL